MQPTGKSAIAPKAYGACVSGRTEINEKALLDSASAEAVFKSAFCIRILLIATAEKEKKLFFFSRCTKGETVL
jgi:hypothetical protein